MPRKPQVKSSNKLIGCGLTIVLGALSRYVVNHGLCKHATAEVVGMIKPQPWRIKYPLKQPFLAV